MLVAVILILALVTLFSGLQILESTVLHPGPSIQETQPSKTITRNGVDYFPRQDITTVLVLGIDRSGPVEDSGSYINPGAADMNILLIFDETAKTCTMLQLNRDTMLEMPVLGLGGRPAGTIYGQLALAHTYGSGLEDSCGNSREAISDFLYGNRIDYYVSMNMDAIAILNDAVGGVTVNVTEDFSEVDPTIKKGEMTLKGQQAINYVRSRQGVGDQQNTSRMKRQQEYLKGFLAALQTKREADSAFFLNAYEEAKDYLLSDCSANGVTVLLDRYGDYEIAKIVTPEGESVVGEQYMEFYVDEEKLDALILRLFYAPKG